MNSTNSRNDTYTVDDLRNLAADANEFFPYLKDGFQEKPLVAVTKHVEEPKQQKNQIKTEKTKKDKKNQQQQKYDNNKFQPYRPESQQPSVLRPQSMPPSMHKTIPNCTPLQKKSENPMAIVNSGKSGLTITKPVKTQDNKHLIQTGNNNNNSTQPAKVEQKQQNQQLTQSSLLAGLISAQNTKAAPKIIPSNIQHDNQGPPGISAANIQQKPPQEHKLSTTPPGFSQTAQSNQNKVIEPSLVTAGPPGFSAANIQQKPTQETQSASTPPGFSQQHSSPQNKILEPTLVTAGPPGFSAANIQQKPPQEPKLSTPPPGFSQAAQSNQNKVIEPPLVASGPPGFSAANIQQNSAQEAHSSQSLPPGFEQQKQSSSNITPTNIQQNSIPEPVLGGPPGFSSNPAAQPQYSNAADHHQTDGPPGFSNPQTQTITPEANPDGNEQESSTDAPENQPVYLTSSPTEKQRQTMKLLFPGYEPFFSPEMSKRVQMDSPIDFHPEEEQSETSEDIDILDDYNPMGASFGSSSNYSSDEEDGEEEDFISIDSDEVEEDFEYESHNQEDPSRPPGFGSFSAPIQSPIHEIITTKESFKYKANICDFNGDIGMILDVENQCASIFLYINSQTLLLKDLSEYQITSGCCLSNSFVFAGKNGFIFSSITNNGNTKFEIEDEICPCKMIKADPLSSNKFFALSSTNELFAVQYNSETKELKKNKLYDQEFLSFDVSSKFLITKVKETKVQIRDRTESNFLPIRTEKIEEKALIFCDDTYLYTYYPRNKQCNLIKINSQDEPPRFVTGVTLAWTSASGVTLLYGSQLLINGENYPYTKQKIAGVAIFSSQAAVWEDISEKATILPLNSKKSQEVSQTGSNELARVTRIFYNKINDNQKKHKQKVEKAIEKYTSTITDSLKAINILTESLIDPITQIHTVNIQNALTPHGCLKLIDTDPNKALKLASEKGEGHILYLLHMGAIERALQDGLVSQSTLLLLLPAIASVLSKSYFSIKVLNLIIDLLDKDDLLVNLTLTSLKQYLLANINQTINGNPDYQDELQKIKEKMNEF